MSKNTFNAKFQSSAPNAKRNKNVILRLLQPIILIPIANR